MAVAGDKRLPPQSGQPFLGEMFHPVFGLLFFLLGTVDVLGQNFACPPDFLLNGNQGDSACDSDNADPRSSCGQQIAPNTTCTFNVFSNDDSVFMAKLQIQASSIFGESSIVVQGVYDTVKNSDPNGLFNLRAAFPSAGNRSVPILTVTIKTAPNSAMSFGYYVLRMNVPSFDADNKNEVILGPGQLAQFIRLQIGKEGQFWVVNAVNKVAISPAIPYDVVSTNLLNIWLYEGTEAQGNLLGSLYSLNAQTKISNTSTVTIQYVLGADDNFQATVMVNDNGNLVNCLTYVVEWAYNEEFATEIGDPRGICYTLINKINDPVPLFLVNFTDGNLNQTYPGITQVIAGGPITDAIAAGSFLASYSSSSSFTLPQSLPGFATTFISNSPSIILSFTRDPSRAKAHVPFPGKGGFIITPSYPYSMPNQISNYYLNSTVNFNFTFTIQQSLSPGASITLYKSTGPSEKIPIAGNINKTFSYMDKLIDLDLDAGNNGGGGVYLTYNVYDAPKAPIVCPSAPFNLQGNVNQDMAPIPANFSCNFTFNFPNNSFAEAFLQAVNLSASDTIILSSPYDSIRNPANSSTFNIHSAFPTSVNIFVQTGASTNLHLSYSMTRKTITFGFNNTLSPVDFQEDAYYIQMKTTPANWIYLITAAENVSVLSATSPDTSAFTLLNYFVYDGIGPNAQLIGSLYSSYKTLWLSPSNSIIIYNTLKGDLPNVGTLIVNDYINFKSTCNVFTAQWSYGNPILGTLDGGLPVDTEIDARTGGQHCLTILNDYDEVTKFPRNQMWIYGAKMTPQGENMGQADVTAGAMGPWKNYKDLVDVPTIGPPSISLPQYFDGFARTIWIQGGLLQLATSIDANVVNPSQAYPGRFGFIMSQNYPFLNYQQDAHFSLQADSNFTVNFQVKFTEAPSDASLTVYSRKGPILTVNLTDPSVTSQNFSVLADLISFTLDGGSFIQNLNRGTFINYQVTQFWAPATTVATVPAISSAGTTNPSLTTSFTAASATNPPAISTSSVTLKPPPASSTAFSTDSIPGSTLPPNFGTSAALSTSLGPTTTVQAVTTAVTSTGTSPSTPPPKGASILKGLIPFILLLLLS